MTPMPPPPHFLLRRLPAIALAVAAIVAGCRSSAPPAEPRPEPEPDWSLRSAEIAEAFINPTIVLTPKALRRIVTPDGPRGWTPDANLERPRGGIEVYSAAAPATVVVRTINGHGSGFVVSADGLIVTNHHVIESGLGNDATSSFATVHLGRLGSDGIMTLDPSAVRARLLRDDPENDLALLRLERPAGAAPLTFLKLAQTAPRPGMDCAIIGHPASGMLWTYRPCEVSSIGDFPRDMVELVMLRLRTSGVQQSQVDALVAGQPKRRIMLTSAQANPGDSGGPVLDRTGALIGVTFAGPGEVSEDKFTYHVHLDEVRQLLTNVPKAPIIFVPDPWDFGATVEPRDLDGDGRMDVLVAGGDRPEMMLFDLDNDTPASLLGSPDQLRALVIERKWDFEVALDLRGSGYVSFYDTQNAGAHDLVLVTDQDSMAAKGKFTKAADGRWTYQPASATDRILAGSHLKTPRLAQRLDQFLRAMRR
ncbi:MAG TPA: trypsin-like peptidase domain-containing protein [Vicinamibacterales bacterium]|nr:trypsin-like peptidase domain-containing protein [Vicinamibacterales bacterium]